MQLCLGAFLKLMVLCRGKNGNRAYSMTDLYQALVCHLPDGGVPIPFDAARVTRILSCRDDLATEFKDLTRRAVADTSFLNELKIQLWESIRSVIAGKKVELFLLGLQDLVRQDQNIGPFTLLNIGNDTTFGQIDLHNNLSDNQGETNSLSQIGEYVTSIFLYIILNTNNRHGEEAAIRQLTPEYLQELKKNEKQEHENQQQTRSAINDFKVLPILNRLSKSVVHNIRTGRDTPVFITRECLYALIRNNLASGEDETFRNLLIKKVFSSDDLRKVKEYCSSQAQKPMNADSLEWKELGRCLILKKDISGRYSNIAISENVSSVADESTVIEDLYQVLDTLLDSSIAGHRRLIDQMCFTFSSFLNALSSFGYYQNINNVDNEVIELRRVQLLNCIRLMQDERCHFVSPNYMFALLERDDQNRDLVDGIDKQVVHRIVLRYYEMITASERIGSIGRQYLEWCTRNNTTFPKKLVTELKCFDLTLWDNYVTTNGDIRTIISMLYSRIFKQFECVPTNGMLVEKIPNIESNRDLIHDVRRMFYLFNDNKAREYRSVVYPLFIWSKIAHDTIPDYFEKIAQMAIYIMHYPALFRDDGNEHYFNRFCQYIVDNTTNRTWLYQCEVFKRFCRWDDVILTDEKALCTIKQRHKAMYTKRQLLSTDRDSTTYRYTPSTRSIRERIETFSKLRTNIAKQKEALKKLLSQMQQEWIYYTPEDRKTCLQFAGDRIDDNDPSILILVLAILDKEKNTTEIRLQKLEAITKRGERRELKSIDEIEILLSPEVSQRILQHPNYLVQDYWQGCLLQMLLTRNNTRRQNDNHEVFRNVEKLKSSLCERFAVLPEEMQIKLIYSIREDAELLAKIDFSLLRFKEPQDNDLSDFYSLWRFYHEIKGGRNIQLGNLSIDAITSRILYECFDALLISNREVQERFGQAWDNVVYHTMRNTREQPLYTVNICAFIAYKLLGLIQNCSNDNSEMNRPFVTRLSELSQHVFSHPCLFNLMTKIMKQLVLPLSSEHHNGLEQIRAYIQRNLNADQREWFDTGITSIKNDDLEKVIIDPNAVYAGKSNKVKDDPRLHEYINGDCCEPFSPCEPIIVVEDDGDLCVIEGRSLVRRVKELSEEFPKLVINMYAYKVVYSNIVVPEKG